jgi:hypothetical protein
MLWQVEHAENDLTRPMLDAPGCSRCGLKHGFGEAFSNRRTGRRTGPERAVRIARKALFCDPCGDLWIHRPSSSLKPNLTRLQPEGEILVDGFAVCDTILPALFRQFARTLMQILTRTLQLVAVKHAGLFRGKPRDTERGRSLVVRTAITLALDRRCLRSRHDGVRGSIPCDRNNPRPHATATPAI